MAEYSCKLCNFNTKLKTNYTNHLATEKHKNNSISKNSISITKNIKKLYTCKYCEKSYSYKQSMHLHIKYNCKKNNDEDLKELVRLINLKLDAKDKQIEIQSKQIDTQNKQIDKLMGKLEINGSFNTTNIQNNITLLAYKDTDLSHLTDKDYITSIKKVNFCVRNLIEKIHFNPEKPENMNIYISNLKNKYLMIYDGKNWNITNKKEIDNLCEDKEMLIEDWIDKEQHKYPEVKDKFMRYINNKEDDDMLNMIKEDIKMMLYNKKNMIENMITNK